MAVILGINAYHPGASSALVIDGIPVVAIPEERLNRIKHYAGFPRLATLECLAVAGLTLADVDIVSIGRQPRANWAQKYQYGFTHPSKLVNLLKIRSARDDLNNIKKLIAVECDSNLKDLRFTVENVEHHLAHTASAYFVSPWENAAGITIDGSGDFVTCMMTECSGPKISIKKRVFVPHSLGTLYTTICEFIGYGKYGDEGKVMGLAPLGTDNYSDIINEMLSLTPDGIQLRSKYLVSFGSDQGMKINRDGTVSVSRHFSDRLALTLGPPRAPNSNINQREKDLACSLQLGFETGYLHLLNILYSKVPIQRLIMAGGCALNSVANGKIFDQTPFSSTCIQPAAGDDGLSLGSALYVSNTILNEGNRWVMEHSFLGPEYSSHEIRKALNEGNVDYEELPQDLLLKKTVAEIADSKVIGWFQGRMEWGPRALGNRSILAHPGALGMKDILNARVKHREAFRPFAPAVLAEKQGDIFENNTPSPYMLHVYKIRPNWQERLQAVNHIDNTGRLQTVTRTSNPLFYDLIKEFYNLTGIPVLLNTSFNENEPIVCSPPEAVSCFLRTKMDVLVVGNFFCKKTL